jgi:hypothetical protein
MLFENIRRVGIVHRYPDWWAVPRLLTLMEFSLFLVHSYVSFYFSFKAYIKEGFSHPNRPHILHEQNPENGTESTA